MDCKTGETGKCAWKSLHARKAKHLSKWHFCQKTEICLGVSIKASKKSCCECLVFFKKKNVVTTTWNGLKPPTTIYNHLQPPQNWFNNCLQQPQKHVQPLANNLKPSETRRYGSVYLGVVVLRVWYFEHALLQLNNCHHILPETINRLLYLFAEPHSLYSMSQSTTIILSFHDNVWKYAHLMPTCLEPNCNIGHK